MLNRQLIFKCYHNSPIIHESGAISNIYTITDKFYIEQGSAAKIEEWSLYLKSIKDLDIPDIIYLAALLNITNYSTFELTKEKVIDALINSPYLNCCNIKTYVNVIDYLRFNSYALPFMDIGLKELIDKKIIKINKSK